MTCPKCYCADCAKERARWVPPTNIPYAVPNPPGILPTPYIPSQPNYPPIIPTFGPPGHWKCSCGMWHPPGYCCQQLGQMSAGSPR